MEVIVIIIFFIFGFVVLGNMYEKWGNKRLHNKSINIPFSKIKPNEYQPLSFYSGGEGTSEQKAIIFEKTGSWNEIPLEREYIESKFGKKRKDWKILFKYQYDRDMKQFEVLEIELSNGTQKKIFFDITKFHRNV